VAIAVFNQGFIHVVSDYFILLGDIHDFFHMVVDSLLDLFNLWLYQDLDLEFFAIFFKNFYLLFAHATYLTLKVSE